MKMRSFLLAVSEGKQKADAATNAVVACEVGNGEIDDGA
jgi:hypothetical protein